MINIADEIKAGVVLVSKFVTSTNNGFAGYIEYINRDDATRNDAFQKYNIFHPEDFDNYQDYMANPEKTSALFTSDKNLLTDEEKQQLKNLFSQGQKNGNLMWQHVISFDNRWLKDNGLYDPETHSVNEEKVMEYTRLAVREMQKREGLLYSSVWSASIHYNAAHHIHVHIAMTEPMQSARPMKEYNGIKQPRGKFKQSTLDRTKSVMINRILNQQPQNKIINDIIRNNVVAQKKKISIKNDFKFAKKMEMLYLCLPKDNLQVWNYNSKEIKHLKPFLDSISKDYLNCYHKEDIEQLQDALKEQEQKYSTAYGDTKRHQNHYAENKMQDLYMRLGNAILKELRDYEKQIRYQRFQEIKAAKQKYTKEKAVFQTKVDMQRIWKKLKYILKDETQHFKNLNAYEELERENSLHHERLI